jgi:type IV pilus assembly protein PilA
MKKMIERLWKKEEGFTLIELIIVIAILAIIAAIAIPNVLSAVDNSRKTADITTASNIASYSAAVRAENDDYSAFTGVANITSPTAITTNDADKYAALVANKFNSDVAPTYKGTTLTNEDYFLVSVSSDGTIKVYVSSSDTATTSGLEVYPDKDSEYDNE